MRLTSPIRFTQPDTRNQNLVGSSSPPTALLFFRDSCHNRKLYLNLSSKAVSTKPYYATPSLGQRLKEEIAGKKIMEVPRNNLLIQLGKISAPIGSRESIDKRFALVKNS